MMRKRVVHAIVALVLGLGLLALGLSTHTILRGTIPSSAAASPGGNLWLTGHDADLHCNGGGPQCHYVKTAVDFVMNGSTLPLLVLDPCPAEPDCDGQTSEVEGALIAAYPPGLLPKYVVVDPRSSAFRDLPLVASGSPLYSAIIVASDFTCGGCDLNTGGPGTPDSDAIKARAADIATFFNAGGGILALAGAEHRSVYYNFLPLPATGLAVTAPFTLTPVGVALGLVDGGPGTPDINCCATHNSFQLPGTGSPLQVAETDSAGFAETLVAKSASVCGVVLCTPVPTVMPTATATRTPTATATPKRYHLDLYVDDLDKAEEQALAIGATKPAEQPTPDRWRVLLDPAGHPFDICLRG